MMRVNEASTRKIESINRNKTDVAAPIFINDWTNWIMPSERFIQMSEWNSFQSNFFGMEFKKRIKFMPINDNKKDSRNSLRSESGLE